VSGAGLCRELSLAVSAEQNLAPKHLLNNARIFVPCYTGKLRLTICVAELVLSNLGLTGIDSLRKSRVSVPGVDGSSPAKKSIKQQSATIRTPWLPSLELSIAIVPPG
jgi:hypothetical protein